MLETGIKGTQQVKVTEENTAIAMGSGTLRVFATPAMIALMEETAWKSVADVLEEGCGTVGIQLNVDHLSATPLGMMVRCESELTEIQGKKLIFKVAAYDEAGLIGEGTHERFIVANEKFQAKADGKLAK
ncbi:MAG: thioesterase family protein [Emergencia sp.]